MKLRRRPPFWLCFFLCPVVAVGEEQPDMPGGPPPRVSIARMGTDGKLELRELSVRFETKSVEREVRQNGVLLSVVEHRRIPVKQSTVRRINPEHIQAFDGSGKSIHSAALAKRLRKRTPVLISTDEQSIDPFYLSIVKSDTLILVMPIDPPPEAFDPPSIDPAAAPLRPNQNH